MPGEGLTHGPPAEKKQAAVTTGLAGSSGIPRAMVLRLIRDLPGDRAFLPPSFARSSARDLGLSVGRPGPHDFAVRDGIVRPTMRHVHRIPRSTFVTTAKRPSDEHGTAGVNHRLLKNGRRIFLQEGLDSKGNQSERAHE